MNASEITVPSPQVGGQHGEQNAIDTTLTLSFLIDLLLHRWLLIFVCGLFGLLLGGLYVMWHPPIFQADALVQVEKNSGMIPGIAELAELTGGPAPVSDTEIPIIKSRSVLGTVVEKLALDIVAEPQHLKFIGKPASRWLGVSDTGELVPKQINLDFLPIQELKHYAWGGEFITVSRLDVKPGWLGQELTVRVLNNDEFIVEGPNGEALGQGKVGEAFVAMEGEQEAVAMFISQFNGLPEQQFKVIKLPWILAVDSLARGLFVSDYAWNTGVLKLSLRGEKRVLIAEILNAVAQTYLQRNVERGTEQARRSLEFVESQLPLVKENTESAEALLNEYQEENRAVDMTLETKLSLDRIAAVENSIALAELERAELRQSYTAEHPSIRNADAKIAKLKENITELEKELDFLPDTQQDILRLNRNVRVNNELYTFLLNQAQELRIVEAGTIGNVRIIDNAVPPIARVAPQSMRLLVFGLAFGLSIGIAWVVLAAAFQKGIRDPESIEKLTGLSVYSVIPHSNRQKRLEKKFGSNAALAKVAPQDPAVEAIRSLRTSLHFALSGQNQKVVAISGSSPALGKSFVSINLAVSIAEAGKRVLLIDADLRRATMQRRLGLRGVDGLSTILINGELPEGIVQSDVLPNVDFIPAGKMPPNPAELLERPTLGYLLQEMAEEYDMIIVDTPPVLAVTDGILIGKHADATFLVIRAGVTTPKELKLTVERFRQNKVALAGCVVNDAGASWLSYGTEYGYYYYDSNA